MTREIFKLICFYSEVFLIGCSSPLNINPCLNSLEIISQDLNENNNLVFKVQGELRDLSKNLYELEYALEQTLGLPDDTFVGTVVFEENFPECFGYFMIDQRLDLKLDTFELGSQVMVELEQIKLNHPIQKTKIMNLKNVEYLYIVKKMIYAK